MKLLILEETCFDITYTKGKYGAFLTELAERFCHTIASINSKIVLSRS